MPVLVTPLQRYGFAALVIGLTLLVRFLMAPLWETTAPFALFMIATVVAAWFAGTGPALLTGAAGLVIRLYFDGPVDGGRLVVSWDEAVRLALFGGFVCGTTVVLERMKRDRRDLERSMAEARAEIEERRKMEAVLRAARAEAEEANRMKDEFLAMVSHELRTPLNAILGWASLLRGGSLSGARMTHAVDVIERNARLQSRLVADLLDVARSLTGRLHLNSAVVDLVAATVESADVVRAEFDDKGVTLATDTPLHPVTVWGDPNRLRQVVANLLGNALKFTPRGGRVSVQVRSVDGGAEIRVSDTGAGIPAAFLPHVFERFTQADSGSTRRHGGLGLGLAIVRQIVELHRGEIDAESDGEGLGARFVVRLPLHTEDRDPDDLPPPAPAEVSDPAVGARRASRGGT